MQIHLTEWCMKQSLTQWCSHRQQTSIKHRHFFLKGPGSWVQDAGLSDPASRNPTTVHEQMLTKSVHTHVTHNLRLKTQTSLMFGIDGDKQMREYLQHTTNALLRAIPLYFLINSRSTTPVDCMLICTLFTNRCSQKASTHMSLVTCI